MANESELAHALNVFGNALTSSEQESHQTLISEYFEPDDGDFRDGEPLSDGELTLFMNNRILSSVIACFEYNNR